MKAAACARVSTERQAERGTIGSQIEALRAHVTSAGDEITAEYRDDGHSGARLDRPGLDALRDAAEAGLFEVIWCLSPDRLARSCAYQVLILDELTRFGVAVRFTGAPALDDQDPQAKLLTQVQGVIAEYERAKIRYRRGKLCRSRAGEVLVAVVLLRSARARRSLGSVSVAGQGRGGSAFWPWPLLLQEQAFSSFSQSAKAWRIRVISSPLAP